MSSKPLNKMDTLPGDLPAGRIDMHCHLLPGLNDGCAHLGESVDCVRRMMDYGFVGSICTLHIWPKMFPMNTPTHIEAQTLQLKQHLRQESLNYRLWPGGEIRLFDGIIDKFRDNGVPTLAHTRLVLTDIWFDRWPKWVMAVFEWLRKQDYQPILAHPERLGCIDDLPKVMPKLEKVGVWLQGNARCMTGEDGYWADKLIRQWLNEARYKLIALDVHGPDDLQSRLEGLTLIESEYDQKTLEWFITEVPRRLVLGSP